MIFKPDTQSIEMYNYFYFYFFAITLNLIFSSKKLHFLLLFFWITNCKCISNQIFFCFVSLLHCLSETFVTKSQIKNVNIKKSKEKKTCQNLSVITTNNNEKKEQEFQKTICLARFVV